jgi:hypothetical protein
MSRPGASSCRLAGASNGPVPAFRYGPRRPVGVTRATGSGNCCRSLRAWRRSRIQGSGSLCSARTSRGSARPPDRRIFQTARGGILQDSGYNEVWNQARKTALTPARYRSPLGRRPYDLRHAAVSLWLNSGVPATEVARRAGHGVAVLLKIYAHCIDGQSDAANERITDALGSQDTQPESEPDDEEDDDSEQAS